MTKDIQLTEFAGGAVSPTNTTAGTYVAQSGFNIQKEFPNYDMRSPKGQKNEFEDTNFEAH